MAEFSWVATTPLSRTLVAGRHGAKAGAAGVSLVEFRDFELIQVMARRGKWDAVATAAAAAFRRAGPGKAAGGRGPARRR